MFSLYLGLIDIDISIFNSCKVALDSIALIYGHFLSNSLFMVYKVVSTLLTSKINAAVNILLCFISLCTSKSILLNMYPQRYRHAE